MFNVKLIFSKVLYTFFKNINQFIINKKRRNFTLLIFRAKRFRKPVHEIIYNKLFEKIIITNNLEDYIINLPGTNRHTL